MRILDKGHAQEIYACLLKKLSISFLILQPMSYFDSHLERCVDFKVVYGRDYFEKVSKTLSEGAIDDKKLKHMMKTIMWEPCDGQDIIYACNELAEEAFVADDITKDERNNIFR